LTPESVQTVTELVAILKAYPAATVQLVGHTDSTGDAEANKKLSLDRADAVKDLAVKGGIDASRLSTAGYGQEKPIASNATEEGKAKNRRLELVVASK
jgi:outer membrane protein OmpA-like peptidoglycan-associated protein